MNASAATPHLELGDAHLYPDVAAALHAQARRHTWPRRRINPCILRPCCPGGHDGADSGAHTQQHSNASDGGGAQSAASHNVHLLPAQGFEARRRLAWMAAACRHAGSARVPGRAHGGGGTSAGGQEGGQPSRQLLSACAGFCCRSARPKRTRIQVCQCRSQQNSSQGGARL